MEAHAQQINDYLTQQIADGFLEGELRAHLLANGWTPADVDAAFKRYHASLARAMPVPQPPAAPSQPVFAAAPGHGLQREPKKRGLTYIVIGAAAVVLIAAGIFAYLALSPDKLDKLAEPALDRHTQNTNRELDANNIATAIAQYVTDHQGALPLATATSPAAKTLNLCGADCDDGDRVGVTLAYYANTPTAVTFRGYITDLKVPDTKTVYIVDSADCAPDRHTIGQSTAGGQTVNAAVLFATDSGSGPEQHCISPY